jgi:phosphoglycerate dehydrogenase-like enzyme
MSSSTVLVIAKPEAGYLQVLDQLPSDVERVIGDHPEALATRAKDADVILNCGAPLEVFGTVFCVAPNVKWVHSASAGVANSLSPELVASAVPLTNGRDVLSSPLAEFAILGALYFDKMVEDMRRQQDEHRWVIMEPDLLEEKTVGIVGYGSIGRAVAQRARAFGMSVWAFVRRPELVADDELVERAFGPDGLRDMLAGSDFVVSCLPLTPATKGMLCEAEIAAMKPSAIFVNVGRGAVVDEAALASALADRRIRGAALDVFATEPLPADSPLWALDNVFLSPHSAGRTRGWLDRQMMKFVENFGHYAAGEPLINMVDKQAGY